MINGQPHTDARNLDVSHHTAAVGVQKPPVGIILRELSAGKGITEIRVQIVIIFMRRLPQGGKILLRQLGGSLGIAADELILPLLVPQVAGDRIKQHPQSQKENENGKNSAQALAFLFALSIGHKNLLTEKMPSDGEKTAKHALRAFPCRRARRSTERRGREPPAGRRMESDDDVYLTGEGIIPRHGDGAAGRTTAPSP